MAGAYTRSCEIGWAPATGRRYGLFGLFVTEQRRREERALRRAIYRQTVMRGFLTWCGALAIGFGAAGIVVSVAFNFLDEVVRLDWSSSCGEILCNSDMAVLALTFAIWLAFGAWLTVRARRWIKSRFSVPRRRARR
jgi:hypothetical protein